MGTRQLIRPPSRHRAPVCRALTACVVLAASGGINTADAQVYRWDNAQLIPGTEGIVPGPGAVFDGLGLDFGSLNFRDLTSASFESSSLVQAKFIRSTLASASFASATVRGTDFTDTVSRGFTSAQLYSTASYQSRNLAGIILAVNNMTGWDFSNQDLSQARLSTSFDVGGTSNLTNANFSNANLTTASLAGADVTGASFADAVIRGAGFAGLRGFTANQLYSTASYQSRDLSGVSFSNTHLRGFDFSNQNLASAIFGFANLTNARFRGANLTSATLSPGFVVGADFSGATLAGVTISGNGFSSAVFHAADFTGARGRANWTESDLRGAIGFTLGGTFRNTILPNGTVGGGSTPGLNLLAGDTLTIRDNPIAVTVDTTFAIAPGATLEFVLSDADFTSTVSTSLQPTLAGTLALNLAPGLDPASLLGTTFDLFNFNGLLPNTTFDAITTNLNPAMYSWDTSDLYLGGTVTLIPAPGAAGTLALAGLATFRRRR